MDMVNAGNEGLAKAVDTFNPQKFKTRFSTYAYSLIQHSIFKMLYMFGTPVRIPIHILDQSRHYKELMDKDDNLTDEELMETLDVSEEGLRKVRMAGTRIMSLDKEVYCDEKSEKSVALSNLIPDPHQVLSDEFTVETDRRSVVRKALNQLDPVDKEIIVDLFFKDKTLKQAGKKHGFSAEAARQRRRKALRKLRVKLGKQMIFGEKQ
jgi:RNA polymerase sigma factor (sigma-70 family)